MSYKTTSDASGTTGSPSTKNAESFGTTSGAPPPPKPQPPASILLVSAPFGALGELGAADVGDETVNFFRCMGLRAPKLYDPKREPNFDGWLNRVVFHMSVSKIFDDKRTS